MRNDLNVLMLTKYDRSGQSSRYRVLQFIPYLESHGFRCTVQSLHAEGYLDARYAGKRTSVFYYAGRLIARTWAVAHASRYAAVLVQKELVPYLPPFLEGMLSLLRKKVIYDIDDAIFLSYGESKNPLVKSILGRKIPAALRLSTAVLAGNSFLKSYASRYNRRTFYFPTVISPEKYAAARAQREAQEPSNGRACRQMGNVPVVAWIGSPETVRFLEERGEVLRSVARGSPFELRVIGAHSVMMPGIEVTCVPWSEETEALELSKCDIGIMPLPQSDWSRGKCGLKLLQYMACELPVVSSPEGGADRIVRHGINGYIAGADDQWYAHLATLLGNAALRRLMGREGRRHVEEHFGLETWAPRMAEILGACIRGKEVEDAAW